MKKVKISKVAIILMVLLLLFQLVFIIYQSKQLGELKSELIDKTIKLEAQKEAYDKVLHILSDSKTK